MSIMQLPGGICFAHGPYKDTMGCPQWPACATDPQKPEYIALAESQKPQPHACPPLSDELRRRIEAELAREVSFVGTLTLDSRLQDEARKKALRWLPREASSLVSQKGKDGC